MPNKPILIVFSNLQLGADFICANNWNAEHLGFSVLVIYTLVLLLIQAFALLINPTFFSKNLHILTGRFATYTISHGIQLFRCVSLDP